MVKRMLILLGLMLSLAACGGDATPAATPEVSSVVGLVNWVHDPYQVVFRAETVGGDDNPDAIYRLNEVPPCTVYGDDRVVWTQDSTTGGMPQVLFDTLTDERVTSFALYLTVDLRFLTYEEGYPKQIPSSTVPVYEKMTLAINDVTHVTDAFAEWPDGFYSIALDTCKKQALTPRKFEPDGAWLSVKNVAYNPNIPSVFWDAKAANFSFNDVSSTGEKRWIEGNLVKILWTAIYENSYDIQFDENGTGMTYQIALQVPGVTRDAPPAPAQ